MSAVLLRWSLKKASTDKLHARVYASVRNVQEHFLKLKPKHDYVYVVHLFMRTNVPVPWNSRLSS